MGWKLGHYLRIRWRSWRGTVKFCVNLFVYGVLRLGLLVYLRNQAKIIRWVQKHPDFYWFWFPFDLSREVVWNSQIKAWVDFLCEGWGGHDFPEEWFRPQANDVVLDVGAYHGCWTIPISRLIGAKGIVVAVEPHPENFGLLLQNLALNSIFNCIPVRAACWNKAGPVWLTGERFRSSEYTISSHASHPEGMWVNGVTLDRLVEGLGLQRLDWIKIDVEGTECEVLEGARQVLHRFRPILLVEVHGTWERLRTLLDEVGYVIEKVRAEPGGWRGFIRARHHLFESA